MSNPFPPSFEHLSHLSDWSLSDQPRRYQKRLSSTSEQLTTVHRELSEALPSILDYLDTKGDPGKFDDANQRLLNLALMTAATGVAVERLGSPSIDAELDVNRLELIRG